MTAPTDTPEALSEQAKQHADVYAADCAAYPNSNPSDWKSRDKLHAAIDRLASLAASAASAASLVAESDKLAHLQAEFDKRLRVSISQGDVIANHVIAMQAAVLEQHYGEGSVEAMNWIKNTLAGPGFMPSIEEAETIPDPDAEGIAQAWFNAKMAEHEAFRAANPGPLAAPLPASPAQPVVAAGDAWDMRLGRLREAIDRVSNGSLGPSFDNAVRMINFVDGNKPWHETTSAIPRPAAPKVEPHETQWAAAPNAVRHCPICRLPCSRQAVDGFVCDNPDHAPKVEAPVAAEAPREYPRSFLHELMGEHDFKLPREAFNAIVDALCSAPVARAEGEARLPARKMAPNAPAPRGWTAIFEDGEAKGWNDCLDAIGTPKAEPPASGLRAETDAGDQSTKE